MKKSLFVIGVSFCATLATPGFANNCVPKNLSGAAHSDPAPYHCKRGEECAIHITATPQDNNSSYVCSLTIDHHEIHAHKKQGHDHIKWIIDSDPADDSFYRFEEVQGRDAICLEKGDAFINGGAEQHRRRFKWELKRGATDQSDYWIFIERWDNNSGVRLGECELHDPIIVNE